MELTVRDLRDRQWVVRRTFAPWWRKVQPLVFFGEQRRRREPVPPVAVPRKSRRAAKKKVDAGTIIGGILLLILSVPDMIGATLAYLLSLPFVALELVVLGVAGGALHVLRTFRLVRHRVDVMGVDGRKLHSLTVLLVRGSRRETNALARGIATTLTESNHAYPTETLPATVTVAARTGFWD